MKILQRFLPGFNHCLGRGPKSALARVQAQARAAALSSLSELSLLLGRFVPEGLLERAPQKEHSRERIFSFRSTFWAFVSQVLTPRTSCLEVVRKVQSFCSAQGLPVPSESDAAYCQARKKLSIERLLKIHQSVSSRLEQQIFSGWLWHERKVVVVDGTGIQLADTKDNQQAYPQPSQQRPGCGFPVMQLVACFCLHTGGLLHWVSSKLTAHESPLLRRILPLLQAGTVLLADRGFASYSNLGLCQEHQIDAVMRLHQARKVDLRRGTRLGKEDRLVLWKRPRRQKGWSKEQWKQLPKSLPVRIVRLPIQCRGFRVRTLWIVTTLTDADLYPKEALGDLYLRRWQAELYLRDIKTTMGMEQLRCKSPAMVQKELLFFVIAYNLLRLLMVEAAILSDQQPHQISFKATADTLRQYRKALWQYRDRPRKLQSIVNDLLLIMASKQVGHRPNRVEPRAVKRRPKSYQLLTRHRSCMQVAKSRRNKGNSPPKPPLT